MTAKFELYVDQGGHTRFRLKAGNGETILAASQGYSSREAARKGIASVQTWDTFMRSVRAGRAPILEALGPGPGAET